LKLATVSVDGRALVVRPFDPGDLHAVELAISESGLGLTTQATKTQIRVPVPPMSQERCEELAKVARRLAEEARVAMRNVRRGALRDSGKLPEDERKRLEAEIEDLVKRYLGFVDSATEAKVSAVLGEDERWCPTDVKHKRKPRRKLVDPDSNGGLVGETC
jgi:ribosome recycling factor